MTETAPAETIQASEAPAKARIGVIPALTVFLSAFLLFQVQPLIGKYILPWFGGAPGVWTACLVFFQVMLLAGYAYSHLVVSRLSPKVQAIMHVILLVAVLATLPIILGFQLLLAALSFDIGNVPTRPIQKILRPTRWLEQQLSKDEKL